MKIYHTAEPFDHLPATEPSATILRMEQSVPEIYDIFLQYQEALVSGVLKRNDLVVDDVYDQLLPVAAQLTMATAIAAQSSKSDD